MGPEGGEAGGEVVAAGTPEEVAGTPGSPTGAYLADVAVVGAVPQARRGRARKVAAAAAVDRATFVGPAGDATRHRAGQLPTRSRAAAGDLRTLADDIAHRAGDVERGQHTWDRLLKRIEEQLREVSGG